MEYDLSKQPIRITLTLEVTQEIVEFAHKVNEFYSNNGPGWKATYRFHVNPILETSIMGFLGEEAVAQVLGVPMRRDFFTNGDGGWDNTVNGFNVQIKCGSGKQVIFHELSYFRETADLVIFAEYLGDRRFPDKNPTFDVWGWCSRKDFMRCHEWRMFGDTKPNAYVDCWNLRTLDTLMALHKPDDNSEELLREMLSAELI